MMQMSKEVIQKVDLRLQGDLPTSITQLDRH